MTTRLSRQRQLVHSSVCSRSTSSSFYNWWLWWRRCRWRHCLLRLSTVIRTRQQQVIASDWQVYLLVNNARSISSLEILSWDWDRVHSAWKNEWVGVVSQSQVTYIGIHYIGHFRCVSKTGPIRLRSLWHKFTNSQNLLIIFGTDIILSWLR